MAKEIVRSGKGKSPTSKLDVGWFLATFLAFALALLAPRIGRALTVFVLLAMAGCLVHPVAQLPWVRNAMSSAAKGIRFAALMLLAVSVIAVLGFYVWPPSHRHEFSQRERYRFERPLKEQRARHEQIQLACPQDDEITCVYAAQFVDFFREAGWGIESNQVERVTLAKPQSGIVLYKRGTGHLDPNNWRSGLWVQMSGSLRSVYRAFHSVGIEPDSAANPSLPDDVITIYFGSEKPNQSEKTDLTRTMKQMDMEIREGHIPNPD